MSTLTPAQVLDVVSDLARGRSTVDVAGRYHLPMQTVIEIRNEHGSDLGQLAKAAEKLKAEQGRPVVPDAFTEPVNATLAMLDKAITIPSLKAKAEKVLALLTAIRDDLANAEKIAGLEAIAKKRADELAAAKKALAEAKGIKSKTKTSTAATSPGQKVRAWAVANGVSVPARGRLPQSVQDAYEAAQA